MRPLLLALAVLATACGPEPVRSARYGLRVSETTELPDYFSPDVLDEHGDVVLASLVDRWGWSEARVRDGLSTEIVTVFAEPIRYNCSSPKGCMGVTLENSLLVVAVPCVYRTALRHEMTHHLQAHVLGVVDYEHARPEWVDAGEAVGTCPEP